MIKIVRWLVFNYCEVCVFLLTYRKVALVFANSHLN